MYYNEAANKKESRKIIGVAAGATAVILALITAIIVVSVNKSNSEVATTEIEKPTTTEVAKPEKEETKEKEPVNDNPYLASVEANKTTETTNKITNTGPEDMLPLALSLGGVVTLASAAILNKREA